MVNIILLSLAFASSVYADSLKCKEWENSKVLEDCLPNGENEKYTVKYDYPDPAD